MSRLHAGHLTVNLNTPVAVKVGRTGMRAVAPANRSTSIVFDVRL